MSTLTYEEKLNLVLQLAEKHDITAYEVGNNTDLNISGVNKIFNGKTKRPSNSTLNIILEYIENKIVGTKYNEGDVKEVSEKYELTKTSKDKLVPYYNIEFSGLQITNFNDVKDSISFYVDYEPLNDCTAFIPYAGDSMLPKYKSGDALGLKEINNFDVLLWGESHFVITDENANNIKTVKNIHPHKDESKVILRSINPEYQGDTVVKKDNILSMFIVKGKVELNQI